MVREALLGSVTWSSLLESCHASQVSMVRRRARRGRRARARPGTLSSSHSSLAPEKYGIDDEPGLSPERLSRLRASSLAARAVRRSCQTMARWTGFPERRSHTTVVSRWLVIRSRRRASGPASLLQREARARDLGRRIPRRRARPSPAAGNVRNSFCAEARAAPRSSNTIARELVVPWSTRENVANGKF